MDNMNSRSAQILSMVTVKDNAVVENKNYIRNFHKPKNKTVNKICDVSKDTGRDLQDSSDYVHKTLKMDYLQLQTITGIEKVTDGSIIAQLRHELLSSPSVPKYENCGKKLPYEKENTSPSAFNNNYAVTEDPLILLDMPVHISIENSDSATMDTFINSKTSTNKAGILQNVTNIADYEYCKLESPSYSGAENKNSAYGMKLDLDKPASHLEVEKMQWECTDLKTDFSNNCTTSLNTTDETCLQIVKNVIIEDLTNVAMPIANAGEDDTCMSEDEEGTIVNETSGSEYVPSDDESVEELNSESKLYTKYDIKERDALQKVKVGSKRQLKLPQEELKERAIVIREAVKDDLGKRYRDKFHCCYFCNKTYKELFKHLQNIHSKESEVAKVLAKPKHSDERRKGFTRLSRIGDYYHNFEVLKQNQGELILTRVPSSEEKTQYTFKDYGPCPDCIGFMLKKNLWHHTKYSCTEKSDPINNLRRQMLSESTALLVNTYSDVPASSEFHKCITSTLKNDIISLVCKQDVLIMKVGVQQFEKYHNTQNELIRQTMRQLARLFIELRKLDPNKNSLTNWLQPAFFDVIVVAVKNICKVYVTTNDRPQFSIPSLALKLGYGLKKCIAIQKGVLLRKEDPQGIEVLNSLLSLMDLEWAARISSNALATMVQRKMNVAELLPLTEDLVKFNTFLNLKLKETTKLLIDCPNSRNWNNLAQVTLCKIVLFNKRRSGEASKMTVLQYSSRPINNSQEFQNTFSPLEVQLASRLAIVQIKGKRERTVSVLLTADIKEAIDLLILHRAKYVSSDNIYLFPRSKPSLEFIRGHYCIRNFSCDANLVQPERINGTKLRKYIATVCQMFDLTENETDWLARHLGHDIRVHREFYRLHESSVELVKVSRLLLAVEGGETKKFHGKKLEDINISDLPDLELDNDLETNHQNFNTCKETDSVSNEVNVLLGKSTTISKTPVASTSDDDDDQSPLPRYKRKPGRTKKISNRKPWAKEESCAVLNYFKDFVKKSRLAPGKDMCTDCLKLNPILTSRSWKDVKYFVYNYLKKLYKT